MNQKADFLKQLDTLFHQQPLAVLATQSEKGPYTSLVAFAATDDFTQILFATTRATRKFSNILRCPNVSLMIDSRTNQVADFRNAIAVTVMGEAEEIKGDEREKMLKRYLEKHPHLETFATAPTCALLAVRVKTYIMVSRFQNVMQLDMTS